MIKKLFNSIPGRPLGFRPDAALAVAALLAGAVGVADELQQATLPGGLQGWMICWRMRWG
jgi:hypothetical protein